MEIEIAGEKVHNPHITYSSDRTGICFYLQKLYSYKLL